MRIITLFLLFIPSILFGQNIDDLKKKAEHENSAQSWNNLAEHLYHKRSNPELLRNATEKSVSIAMAQNDKVELGRAYIYLSDLYFQDGDIKKYLSTNRQALDLLSNTKKYSLREEALNNIATAHGEQDDIDSLLFYTQKAIALNRQNKGLQSQLGNEYQNMSYAYSIKGAIDSSIYYTKKTIEALSNAKDTLRMLDAYNQMGVIYVKNKNYPLALKYFNESLSIYDKIENKHNRLYIYTNLAAMYQKWGDMNKAVDFSRKAVLDAKNSQEKITYGKLLCNLGAHLHRIKDYKSSVDTLQLALPYIKDSHYYQGTAYQVLASNYSSMKNIDSATLYLSMVDSLASIKQFTRGELFYASKANILAQQSKYKEAIPYVYKFIEMDSQKELKDSDPIIYNMVSEVLAKGAGDYKKALEYKKIASSIQDSLYQKESSARLNEFYVQYQTAEKDLKISQLNEERQRILYNRTLIVGGLIFLATLLTVALLYNRIKRYKKEKEALELAKKIERKELDYKSLLSETESRLVKRYLEGRELERKSLAKELHDSVANDIVSTIMLYENGDKEKQVSLMLKDIYTHIRQISHQLMPPEFKYISLIGMLEDYVEILNNATPTHFFINITDASILSIIEEVPDRQKKDIYYIIQEALGNICKHANAKKAEIKLFQNEDKKLILSIEDDGKGFNIQSTNRGIGTQTMEDRCIGLNAELKIESEIGSGTSITISLFCSTSPMPNHQC